MSFFSHSLREGGVSLCVVKNSSSQFPAPRCLLKVGQQPFSSFPLARFSPSVCLLLSHIAHTSLTHRSHICTHLALILHSSCTHLSLICHSSQEEEKRRRKRFPHTPYKKKKIKEEENPIFFLTSEYWGARDIFQRISAKAKGLLAKSWSSRRNRTSLTCLTSPTRLTSANRLLTHSHPAAYCSRGCSGASACRTARCSRVSRQ